MGRVNPIIATTPTPPTTPPPPITTTTTSSSSSSLVVSPCTKWDRWVIYLAIPCPAPPHFTPIRWRGESAHDNFMLCFSPSPIHSTLLYFSKNNLLCPTTLTYPTSAILFYRSPTTLLYPMLLKKYHTWSLKSEKSMTTKEIHLH